MEEESKVWKGLCDDRTPQLAGTARTAEYRQSLYRMTFKHHKSVVLLWLSFMVMIGVCLVLMKESDCGVRREMVFSETFSEDFVGLKVEPAVVGKAEVNKTNAEPMIYEATNEAIQLWSYNYSIIRQPAATYIDTTKTIHVCVISKASNFDKRMVVRETWGTTEEFQVNFIIGTPTGSDEAALTKQIEEEQEKFNDMAQMNFDEAYKNLTHKTVSLVMWAWKVRWPNRKFVLKVDDDVMLNSPLLLRHIHEFTQTAMYGGLAKGWTPIRDEKSKYYLSKDEFPGSTFPDMLPGSFYIITEPAMAPLYKNLFAHKFVFLEDVYFTGLVAEAAHIPRLNLPSGMKVVIEGSTSLSDLINIVSKHDVRLSASRKAWWFIKDGSGYSL